MTKFGFIRSGKGEIFWRKTQRNETKAQLNDLERRRLQAYLFPITLKKRQMMATFFLLFFLSTVFTLVISAICHLKEDKISFSEKI